MRLRAKATYVYVRTVEAVRGGMRARGLLCAL